MNYTQRLRIIFFACTLLLAFSCSDEDSLTLVKNGETSFTFSHESLSNGRSTSEAVPAFVFVNIEDADGEIVVKNQKIALMSFGSGYVSESILLRTGSFKLVSFLVLDENSKAIYATPLEGSEKADLVDDALAIEFAVQENASTSVTPEVLRIQPSDVPEQFGYTSFGFDVVDGATTMGVLVKVELTIGDVPYLDVQSTITVSGYSANNELKWTQNYLYNGPYDNELPIKAGYDHYTFEVNQWGAHIHQVHNGTYLMEHSTASGSPVTYVLTGGAEAKKLSSIVTYKKVFEDNIDYWEPQNRRRYEYNAAGKLERMTVSTFVDSLGGFIPLRYFVFSYTDGKMTKISGHQASTDLLYLEERYEYQDGNVSKITQDYVDGSNIDWVGNFTYSYTNRVINASYVAANGGAFQYELRLPHGNAVSDKTTRGNQLCSNGEYQYDRAINPFKHLGYMDFLLANYSLNNRTAENIDYVGCAFPTLVPELYEYEYNELGYPTAMNTLYEGRNYETRTTFFYQ